jgi:hypothetical protein
VRRSAKPKLSDVRLQYSLFAQNTRYTAAQPSGTTIFRTAPARAVEAGRVMSRTTRDSARAAQATDAFATSAKPSPDARRSTSKLPIHCHVHPPRRPIRQRQREASPCTNAIDALGRRLPGDSDTPVGACAPGRGTRLDPRVFTGCARPLMTMGTLPQVADSTEGPSRSRPTCASAAPTSAYPNRPSGNTRWENSYQPPSARKPASHRGRASTCGTNGSFSQSVPLTSSLTP